MIYVVAIAAMLPIQGLLHYAARAACAAVAPDGDPAVELAPLWLAGAGWVVGVTWLAVGGPHPAPAAFAVAGGADALAWAAERLGAPQRR